MLIGLACLGAYAAAGLLVAWWTDADRHYCAERLTAYDPARARRMCTYGWIADTLMWPFLLPCKLIAVALRKWGR